VVPTVLAIIARLSCLRSPGSGVNVVPFSAVTMKYSPRSEHPACPAQGFSVSPWQVAHEYGLANSRG
jgi:hypothetical protein